MITHCPSCRKRIYQNEDLLSIEYLFLVVKVHFGFTDRQMKGKSREGLLPVARHMFWWLCRKHTEKSYSEMGKRLGRDHTTAIHGVRNVNNLIFTKDKLVSHLEAIESIISVKDDAKYLKVA